MFDEIRALYFCAGELRYVLFISDAAVKMMRFVSDDAWGPDRLLVCRIIAAFREKLGV